MFTVMGDAPIVVNSCVLGTKPDSILLLVVVPEFWLLQSVVLSAVAVDMGSVFTGVVVSVLAAVVFEFDDNKDEVLAEANDEVDDDIAVDSVELIEELDEPDDPDEDGDGDGEDEPIKLFGDFGELFR